MDLSKQCENYSSKISHSEHSLVIEINTSRTHGRESRGSRVVEVVAPLRFVKRGSLSSLLIPPCSTDSPNSYFFFLVAGARVFLPRESSRQSCPDRYERFVCIVLRQRQHVSRTRYFSPPSRIVTPSPSPLPVRGKNSLV